MTLSKPNLLGLIIAIGFLALAFMVATVPYEQSPTPSTVQEAAYTTAALIFIGFSGLFGLVAFKIRTWWTYVVSVLPIFAGLTYYIFVTAQQAGVLPTF